MKPNQYRTKDLGETSALIAMKICLVGIDRIEHICWFIFEDYDLCKKLSSQYFFGDLQVNAREFYEAMLRAKGKIFNN